MSWLLKIERAIVLACSVFLAATFCLVVLLRYGFESDLFAYEEWVLTVAFLLYFLGGSLASRYDAHIKADILLEFIRRDSAKALYRGAIFLLEALIVAVLAYFAWKMLLKEFIRWPDIPTTPVYKIPLAVPRFFIVLGFILMAWHSLINAVQQIKAGLQLRRDERDALLPAHSAHKKAGRKP